MKDIGDLKDPGIDCFNAYFFKKAWYTIIKDVYEAVMDFFVSSTLYPTLNCTLVTLIPKTPEAVKVKDMHPIALCPTMYKIISKILSTRLGKVINRIVDDSQSAFLPGKVIQENILLAQELVKGYNQKGISPRCMI